MGIRGPGQRSITDIAHIMPQCLQQGLGLPLPAHRGLSISAAAPFPQGRALPVAVELINPSLEQAVELLLELVPNEAVQQRVDAAVGKGHADAEWQRCVDEPCHRTAADDAHVSQGIQKRQNVEREPGNQEGHDNSGHQLEDFVPLLLVFPKLPCSEQGLPDPHVARGDHRQGDEEAQCVLQEGCCHSPLCIALLRKGHDASIDPQAFDGVSVTEIKGWEGGQTGEAPHNQCCAISFLQSSPLRVHRMDNSVVPVHAHAGDEKYTCKHVQAQNRAGDLAHERPKEPVIALCVVGSPEGKGGEAQQVRHSQVEDVDVGDCFGAAVPTKHHNHHAVTNQPQSQDHGEERWNEGKLVT